LRPFVLSGRPQPAKEQTKVDDSSFESVRQARRLPDIFLSTTATATTQLSKQPGVLLAAVLPGNALPGQLKLPYGLLDCLTFSAQPNVVHRIFTGRDLWDSFSKARCC